MADSIELGKIKMEKLLNCAGVEYLSY